MKNKNQRAFREKPISALQARVLLLFYIVVVSGAAYYFEN